MCIRSALGRGLEVPVDVCTVKCPWCVSLLVPMARNTFPIYCTCAYLYYTLHPQSRAIIRKQKNGQPPCFLGRFLTSRARVPQFLRQQVDWKDRQALLSRNRNHDPLVACKNH